MLKPINYRLIESDQLFTFGKGVTDLFVSFDPNKDTYVLRSFVNKASHAFAEFGKSYERELKNPYTAKLKEADRLRDAAYHYFRDFVASFGNSDDSAEKNAAIRLVEVMEKHGWQAANFGFKAETAAFNKMINEIRDYRTGDLDLLGAKPRFDKWVTREKEFETLQQESASREPSGLPTVTDTKPKLVDALRTLMTMVDNHYTENPGDAQLASYVKAMNELITLTMATARAAATRDENKKKENGNGDKPVG